MNKVKVIVIGGGWSGVSAALTCKNLGADVEIFEKTDMLLGLGNVGGIMRNNGRFTAAEELIAMGADELFNITDICSEHINIDFPGHKHASLYNVIKVEPMVRELLLEKGIKINLISRITDVEFRNGTLYGIYDQNGNYSEANVFIETTGSTGPMGNCMKYGNGCSMCILRCPSFGPRISISSRCGVKDISGERGDTLGAFSGSCELARESLSDEIVSQLDNYGKCIIKVPIEDINEEKLTKKVCQQYALKEYAENIILLDTGHVKLMTSYYPLDKLRKIKGLERARYVDPYSGGKGNSIRYLSVAPRNNHLKVNGVKNLFVGGEKSGLFVGHTEAIATGATSGLNALRFIQGKDLIELPDSIAVGDIISYANSKSETSEGRNMRYTFAGSVFFDRMREKNLYTTNIEEIKKRVEKASVKGIFKI